MANDKMQIIIRLSDITKEISDLEIERMTLQDELDGIDEKPNDRVNRPKKATGENNEIIR